MLKAQNEFLQWQNSTLLKNLEDIQSKLELITSELNKGDETDQSNLKCSSNRLMEVKTYKTSITESKLFLESFTLGTENTEKRLEYFKHIQSKREALVDDLFREIDYLRESQDHHQRLKKDQHRLVQQTRALKKSNLQIGIYRYWVYSV